MKDVRITVMRITTYPDLIEKYENPIEHTCDMAEGMEFISRGAEMPGGFCSSAWHNLHPYVLALAHGAEDFFDGWMQNKKSAMISCNDGFRPVSFLLEAIDR